MAQNSILRDKYLDTQHVYAGSGADTSPSYTFSSDLSTGIYRTTEGSVVTSIGGTDRFIIGSTQVSTNAVVLISNTTASASATTGALVVSGSVGVAGSLNVAGSSILNSLSLNTLNAGSSTLTSLNVTGSSTLTSLNAGSSTLSSLNAGSSTLTSLNVTGSSTLNSLNASSSTLSSLNAGSSTLSSLNVTGSSTLNSLNAGSSTLSSLSVTSAIYINNVNINNNNILNGRLTLTTNVPVTTTDVTAATTLYFTPYRGNYITLYTNSLWKLYTFSQLSIAVPATTATNYDVFIYDNAGVLTLLLTAWTNGTTRATSLTFQDSVYVQTGNLNYRYLGSFRTTGVSGQTEDSALNRLLYNYYNRTPKSSIMMCTTASWTYSSTTVRVANGSTANAVVIMTGISEDTTSLALSTNAYGGGGHQYTTGFGLNSTTAYSASGTIALAQSTGINTTTASFSAALPLGINTVYYLENASGTLANVQGVLIGAGGTVRSGITGTTFC